MKTLFLTTLFTLSCVFAAQVQAPAQTVYHLTLEESIGIAKSKSYSMLKLEQDLAYAENNLKATIGRYRTHVTLDLTLPNYTETVQEWSDSTGISYYPLKRLQNTARLRIEQPLPTDGRVYMNTRLSATDDYYKDLRSSQFSTQIGLEQPLDAFFGYNSYQASLKTARLDYERSAKSLKREELNLIYQVSSSYYNLLSLQKRVEIAQLDLDRQSEAFDISQKKFESGLLREVDALQMEVDLAEAQDNYDISVLNYGSSTNSFKDLLGIELRDSVVLKSDLRYEAVGVDPDKAVRLALENRLEIREQEIQIELQELVLKQRRAAARPSASLNAYYDLIGVSSDALSMGYWSSINRSFDDVSKRPSNFGVGMTVSIPIFNWGENRSLIRATEARFKQAQLNKIDVERNIETEVRNLTASLQSSLRRLQLLERNVSVAEKSFEITLKRFTDGDIDSQALALDRARLNTAYTNHLNAFINYQLTLADLMRKTFYDFQRDVPVD